MAFEAKLSLVIVENGEKYFADNVEFTGFEYDGVVMLQNVFLSMLNKFGDIGLQKAMEKGVLSPEEVDKLKALLA